MTWLWQIKSSPYRKQYSNAKQWHFLIHKKHAALFKIFSKECSYIIHKKCENIFKTVKHFVTKSKNRISWGDQIMIQLHTDIPNWNGALPDGPAVKLMAGADGLPKLKPPATKWYHQNTKDHICMAHQPILLYEMETKSWSADKHINGVLLTISVIS